MPVVFISYSHKDILFADALQQITNIIGYTSWRDKTRITGGLKFTKEITRGIEDSPIFMPLFSPDYFKSEMCKKELKYATRENKYIFPIVIDGDAPSDLHCIHQIRLKCSDRPNVSSTALAKTIKELHDVIGDPATVPIRFPEGSDPSWPEETLELNLTDTRWSWCDNHEFIGDNWIEFLAGNRVTRSWKRHLDGYWEVLKNGLVRFGPHIVSVDLEKGLLTGAHGEPQHTPAERSGRFLRHLSEDNELD